MTIKAVAFLVAHTVGTLYNAGDVAGFETETADDLIKRGIAKAYSKGDDTIYEPGALKAKKSGEGWSVFAGRKELVKGLSDQNAADAWIAERSIQRVEPEVRQVGETWSVFAGEDVLIKDLPDEAAARTWITENRA